ncbi:hypothetical protein S7711_03701 [Stachybotrys chartarum IBT 7711]|uniref:Uncharacterized protein n=1 Tax=Stachybotrys chartarum (strain CBS 109288 / IBT 7711) TaxID=1280523 RepID=A0A084B7L2_STACB|nr:hypothetical protein S7711_03701 [Stachybotrys chartarum IBT 7711]
MAISDSQSRFHYSKYNSSALKSTHRRRQSTGTTANNAEVEKLIHQMKHTLNYPAYKPNLRTSNFHEAFIKLEELFHILSEDVVLDMEIKYPMFFKADDFEMDTYALELNCLVKTILGCFQALWTKTPDRARCLANSEPSAISDSAVNLHPSPTFSPKVCMLLTVKQQIYLVLFLNDSSVWPIGDPRTVSTQSAVHFARQFGLRVLRWLPSHSCWLRA